ncbi:MAG: hypothetical protein ACRD94_02010 [Nitrosopumilaceae archaeon]
MRFLLILLIVMVFFVPAFGFQIHNQDYENSLYDNKKMPSIGKPVQLFYQVVNYTPEPKSYEVTITITNLDEEIQVYSKEYHYRILSDQYEDIIWSFTPQTEGLYLVKAVEDSGKTAKYVFAIPENEELRNMAKIDPTSIKDKSPRQQFRMGIDPKEIICKESLYLALKPSSLPVCVTLETLQELRQRDFVIGEFIDYERIGHFLSEAQFTNILTEKNVGYTPDNFLLIQGVMLPMGVPMIEYCGYVLDNSKEDYWFSSNYQGYNLTSYEIHDENPNPCMVGELSCGCLLQTQLEEKNLKELSYFDESQEAQVGKIFQDYLNEGYKVTNVPNAFVIGKYNLEIAPDITSFCGQFKGKGHERYFQGNIKDSKVLQWGLELDVKPKLCAINDNAQMFSIDKSAIAKDSFEGQ